VKCHGPTRRKGGLQLHTAEVIRRGIDDGSILPDDDEASELLRRIRLRISHDDHMPPEDEPQLAARQVEMLARWVAAGAPIDAEAADADAALVEAAAPRTPSHVPRELPRQAMDDLQAAHVHVEIIDPKLKLLWIDLTAVPDVSLGEAVRLLKPLAPSTSDLSLRGVKLANAVLTRCGPWEQLRRLDVSGTRVNRHGLAAATKSGRLVELTLIDARLTPEATKALLRLETVEHLHVWGSNIPAGVLARLRERDTLVLNEGSVESPAPVEVEPEFEFGPPKAVAMSLEPVNSKCPVTDAPADAAFSIVHNGRVIAFCCKVCPGRFWDDPGKFPVNAD
jgi:hypothetical protein